MKKKSPKINKSKSNNVRCRPGSYTNYSKSIDKEIKETIKNADKIEREIIEVQKHMRLLL